ncbi:hypothetical protein JKG68_26020 [Microvirga aerilata]|uniref:8-amino-7-oxononanoate synthase n=1 Tax=Microvirga aerilata TaxID=670292 RepID=A0A936ZGK5_9HYPH|nr:hypothetical protein [Microvirga aerilata]MBL0407380.1 hypothetical protein [Microvirga aerilata]
MPDATDWVATLKTDSNGVVQFNSLERRGYIVCVNHYPQPARVFDIPEGCIREIEVDLGIAFTINSRFLTSACDPIPCAQPRVNDIVEFRASGRGLDTGAEEVSLIWPPNASTDPTDPRVAIAQITAPGYQKYRLGFATAYAPTAGAPPQGSSTQVVTMADVTAMPVAANVVTGNLGVALSRTGTSPTTDLAFWQGIIESTERLSFNTYLRFMNHIFCGAPANADDEAPFAIGRDQYDRLKPLRMLPFTDSDAYRVVKAATEAFVMINCGVFTDGRVRDPDYLARRDLPPAGPISDYLVTIPNGAGGTLQTLPYLALIRSKLPDIGIKLNTLAIPGGLAQDCHGILSEKLTHPCMLELIWSYWHEEGMLVQTLNMIARRFQNVRGPGERDPLANLDIDPLRPLSNLLWGYTLDEQHRLSIVRRNYEYDHHYGLRLEGKAVGPMRPADSRSRFLEAFHNLLRLCLVFYRQDDDTTIKADAFPVLNALKEVHLILSQGAHNQFGDLPSTARIEMMMQQWLLARPEFREFLPTRLMVAYPEPWMDRVDAMKKMQGWSDTSVLNFRNLGLFGEQLLLSIRWGHWSDVFEPIQAFNWARFFRPQIQGYTHAYRAVTGVDLTTDKPDAQVEATLPSVLLQRRLAQQHRSVTPV